MSFENEYTKGGKKKDPLNAFLPVIGLLLAVCFGVIAYFTYEPAHEFLAQQISSLPQQDDEGYTEMGYVIGVGIFLILMMFTAMLYAIFAPKPPKLATEAQLKKEREAMAVERIAKKRRKQQINKQAAADREKKEREAEQSKRRKS